MIFVTNDPFNQTTNRNSNNIQINYIYGNKNINRCSFVIIK